MMEMICIPYHNFSLDNLGYELKPILESYTTSKDDLRPNGQYLDEVLGVSTFHRIVKGYIH